MTGSRRRGRGGESGQALVWAAVMLPFLFIPIVGLTVDGGIVFDARRELQNAADAAARAGAMQVDVRTYRESAGTRVVLDQASARQIASEYLAGHSPGLSGSVATDAQRVVVEVSRDVPTSFLRIVGVNTVRIGASAPAEVRFGIERGNR